MTLLLLICFANHMAKRNVTVDKNLHQLEELMKNKNFYKTKKRNELLVVLIKKNQKQLKTETRCRITRCDKGSRDVTRDHEM